MLFTFSKFGAFDDDGYKAHSHDVSTPAMRNIGAYGTKEPI